MKLLLHICCAPCSIHPLEETCGGEFDSVTGFFYNPNIHPYSEYIKRKDALQEYSRRHNMRVVFGDYDMENYFRKVAGREGPGVRCGACWQMRLDATAAYASRNGYDSFSTTLLVSPYQDQEKIKSIGKSAGKRFGVGFFYKDFRGGFKTAQGRAKEENLYRQNYCGCIFSEKERYEKR